MQHARFCRSESCKNSLFSLNCHKDDIRIAYNGRMTDSTRFYFKVGTRYSAEDLFAYGPERLRSREILDPAFRTPDTGFNWRNYVELKFQNRKFQSYVELSLDQFAKTVTGQQLIRQAAAVQKMRYDQYTANETRQNHSSDPIMLPKVTITDHKKPLPETVPAISSTSPSEGERSNDSYNGVGGKFDLLTGQLTMQYGQIKDYEYRGTDGRYHDFSIQMALIHELVHAADPLFMRGSPLYDSGYDPKTTIKAIIEYPAVALHNQFMKTYYDTAERVPLDYSRPFEPQIIRVKDECGILSRSSDVPKDLGCDHTYDEIKHPDPGLRSVKPQRTRSF